MRAKTPPHIYLSLLSHRLLHTDHRHHLKNNLMHDCSPPCVALPSVVFHLFFCLGPYHPGCWGGEGAGGWGGGETAAEGVMKKRN